jgi:hypothetical protein
MLKPIKTFYVKGIPNLIDWEEAVNIAKEESCVVELRWMPNIMTGYYHEYVFEDSDPVKIDEKTPKIYGW